MVVALMGSWDGKMPIRCYVAQLIDPPLNFIAACIVHYSNNILIHWSLN